MTNKIEISRELAERLTRYYPAEITDQATMQAIRIETLAALDELRALLAAPAVERQEPVAWVNDQQLLLCSKSPLEDQPNNPMMHNLPRNIAGSALRTDYCNTPLYTSPPAPVAVVNECDTLRAKLADREALLREASEWVKANSFGGTDAIDLIVRLDYTSACEKYDEVLFPFLAMMRKELHANADKGDRPGWLSMSSDTALLEIIYHFGKLQASVRRGDDGGIREYAADVANMCMMLTDVCACLDKVKEMNQ